MMVALAILAPATKISSTLLMSLRSLELHPLSSSSKCLPSACNQVTPFHESGQFFFYRTSYPVFPEVGQKFCVTIAEPFQLSIRFFRPTTNLSLQLGIAAFRAAAGYTLRKRRGVGIAGMLQSVP
jgi:hypothetical protein